MPQSTDDIPTPTYFGCIYKVTNNVNGKVYFGQTIAHPPKLRWRAHVGDALRLNSNIKFHRAIRKYGPENFTWAVVKYANSAEELNKLEAEFVNPVLIETPKMSYNTRLGGNGRVWTPELGKNISAGKIKRNQLKGLPKWSKPHPNQIIIDKNEFEQLIKSDLTVPQIYQKIGRNPQSIKNWCKREYGLSSLVQVRSLICNKNIHEARASYKPFDRGEFLHLIKQGVKFYEMSAIFKQDISCLKRKWKGWYPDKKFPDLQANIDDLIADYNANPHALGNYAIPEKIELYYKV